MQLSKNNKRKRQVNKSGNFTGEFNFSYILIAGIFIIVFVVGFYGFKAYNYFFYKRKVFLVKNIVVIGNGITKEEKRLAIRRSGIRKGENLLSVNLKKVSRLVASQAWVRGVTVYRNFPDSVDIDVIKRHIFAMISNGGNLYYISRKGYVMEEATSKSGYDYPIITGLGGNSPGDYLDGIKKVLHFLTVSKTSIISKLISEVHLENDGGIVVYTKGGTTIKFGTSGYTDKLKILKDLFYEINRIKLKYKPYINLEYKDEAVVAVSDGSRVLPANYKNNKISSDIWK